MAVSLLGPLYTANVVATEQTILDAVDAARAAGEVTELTLDCSTLQDISVTVILALQNLDQELAGRGVRLRVRGLPSAAHAVAARTKWFQGLEAEGRVL